jgi:type II secretory ATPase GspE/PulE/Tfp pilus assembly ATPase PilB-like protein
MKKTVQTIFLSLKRPVRILIQPSYFTREVRLSQYNLSTDLAVAVFHIPQYNTKVTNTCHLCNYMETLACIKCFPAGSLLIAASGTESLSFNPIKLFILCGWVYLCFYFVQQVQYSLLVPPKYKTIAKLSALFVGPILFFVLLIADISRQISSERQKNVFDIIKQRFRNAFAGRGPSGPAKPREQAAIKLLDSSGTELKQIYGHGKSKREDRHILDITEHIIWDALQEQASDILIDPKNDSTYTVRYRVDGVLRIVEQLETGKCQAVINSIKAVSNMDISERRRPQDGAFIAQTADGTASFRVASAGVVNGEKLSVRVLSKKAGMYTLENVGLSDKHRSIIKNEISKPSGMILMCGPTGSGKTTSLYAMLNEIDLYTRNVITVEDPIECVLSHASQIEVNPKAGITFAKSLRSILRQDPDVISVGEIRDEETAEIALRASQTGHLVLATIHSYSNESALVRLLDLGVTEVLISSGLDLVISQRLLRRLCSKCRKPAQLTKNQIADFRRKKIDYKHLFRAEGCELCHGTGYRGRTAIFDMLVVDNELKASIVSSDAWITKLRKAGDEQGKSNLRKQGLKMVLSGVTSLEELKRVIG